VSIRIRPYECTCAHHCGWCGLELNRCRRLVLEAGSLPRVLRHIGGYAFYQCGLTVLELPPTLTSVSDHTFALCTALTTIRFPAALTEIGASAFEGCSKLRRLHIPDAVLTVGPEAFRGCNSLVELVLPRSLRFLGVGAFLGSAEQLRLLAVPKEATIHCPRGRALASRTGVTVSVSTARPPGGTALASELSSLDCAALGGLGSATNVLLISAPDEWVRQLGGACLMCDRMSEVPAASKIGCVGPCT
jgi:hypothetical protein